MFHPGQKYKPSAARENEIDRMLRDYRAGSGAFVRPDSREMPIGHVMAKNTTGADLALGYGAIYRMNGWKNTEGTWTRADYDPRKGIITLVANTNVVSNPNPSEEIGGLAITLEPIKNNTLGRVAIGGIAFFAQPMIGTQSDQRYLYPHATGILSGFFGFARRLCEDATNSDFELVDLSDRQTECYYTLTANMASGSATANMDAGNTSWSTTVHDVHSIAAYQKSGDTGFAEWRGTKWCIKIPFC